MYVCMYILVYTPVTQGTVTTSQRTVAYGTGKYHYQARNVKFSSGNLVPLNTHKIIIQLQNRVEIAVFSKLKCIALIKISLWRSGSLVYDYTSLPPHICKYIYMYIDFLMLVK